MKMKNEKCIECGKDISQTRKEKYCSNKCAYEFNRERLLSRSKRIYNKKIKPLNKIIKEKRDCKECNKSFILISSSPKQIYCSEECSKNFWIKKRYDMSKGIIVKENCKGSNYYLLRFEIFKRDNFTCQYCGRNVKEDKIKLHVDHIYPKSKGGLFVANNLTTSCVECNLGKTDVLLEDRRLNEIKKEDE